MTDTMTRPLYGGGLALRPDRPISRTAPPQRRAFQADERQRRTPLAAVAPRRPFRVRIYCNGDRFFKVPTDRS